MKSNGVEKTMNTDSEREIIVIQQFWSWDYDLTTTNLVHFQLNQQK